MPSDISAIAESRCRRLLVWLVPLLWTLGLGLWGLSRQDSVWRDEAATWQVAGRSPGEIWAMLANVDAVHGFYYLLMHWLFEVFGASTATLRLPSVLAVSAAAACVALIGRRLAGFWAGLGGGLALGLLPHGPVLPPGGPPVRAGRGGGRARHAAAGLAVGARARAADLAALGCVRDRRAGVRPAELAVPAGPARARGDPGVAAGRAGVWLRWAACGSGAVAGALPLILFSRGQSEQVSWIPPLAWHMLIGPGILLAIGGLGAWADRSGRRDRSDRPDLSGRKGLSVAAVGLPLLAVPQLGLIGLSLVQPLFQDRYVLFSMVGLALLIGAALGAAVRACAPRLPRASGLLVPGVAGLSVLALLPVELDKRAPASRVDDVLAVVEARWRG